MKEFVADLPPGGGAKLEVEGHDGGVELRVIGGEDVLLDQSDVLVLIGYLQYALGEGEWPPTKKGRPQAWVSRRVLLRVEFEHPPLSGGLLAGSDAPCPDRGSRVELDGHFLGGSRRTVLRPQAPWCYACGAEWRDVGNRVVEEGL